MCSGEPSPTRRGSLTGPGHPQSACGPHAHLRSRLTQEPSLGLRVTGARNSAGSAKTSSSTAASSSQPRVCGGVLVFPTFGSMAFVYNGVEYKVDHMGVVAGESHGSAVLFSVGEVEFGGLLALWMDFPLEQLQDGASFTMDWSQGQAYLYHGETGTGSAWGVAAYLGNGPVVFERASDASGAVLRGSADLNVYGGR